MSARFVPARVPLIDPRTGLISREWYLFFQNFMDGAGASVTDDLTLFSSGAITGQADGSGGSGGDDELASMAITAVPDEAQELQERADIPANIAKQEIIDILGYTPANKAGDTFTGPIIAPTITSTGAVVATGDVSGGSLTSGGEITAGSLPVYANDAAAGAGGLTHGMFYQTATGELRIKL